MFSGSNLVKCVLYLMPSLWVSSSFLFEDDYGPGGGRTTRLRFSPFGKSISKTECRLGKPRVFGKIKIIFGR